MARLKAGLDVWECTCGAIIVMGRLCGCGKCYADILRENSGIREKKKEVKKGSPGAWKNRKIFQKFLFQKGRLTKWMTKEKMCSQFC